MYPHVVFGSYLFVTLRAANPKQHSLLAASWPCLRTVGKEMRWDSHNMNSIRFWHLSSSTSIGFAWPWRMIILSSLSIIPDENSKIWSEWAAKPLFQDGRNYIVLHLLGCFCAVYSLEMLLNKPQLIVNVFSKVKHWYSKTPKKSVKHDKKVTKVTSQQTRSRQTSITPMVTGRDFWVYPPRAASEFCAAELTRPQRVINQI